MSLTENGAVGKGGARVEHRSCEHYLILVWLVTVGDSVYDAIRGIVAMM